MVLALTVALLVGDVPRPVAPPRHHLLLLSVPEASTLESADSPVSSVPSPSGQDWLHEDSQDWQQYCAKHPAEVGAQCWTQLCAANQRKSPGTS